MSGARSFAVGGQLGFPPPSGDSASHKIGASNPVVARLKQHPGVVEIPTEIGRPRWKDAVLVQRNIRQFEKAAQLESVIVPIAAGKRRSTILAFRATEDAKDAAPVIVNLAMRKGGGWSIKFLHLNGQEYFNAETDERKVESINITDSFFGPGNVAGKCVDDCIIDKVESWLFATCAVTGSPLAAASCLSFILGYCRGLCGLDD